MIHGEEGSNGGNPINGRELLANFITLHIHVHIRRSSNRKRYNVLAGLRISYACGFLRVLRFVHQ